MKNYLHSGGAGDVIYSLPFVRHVGARVHFFVKPENEFNRACDVHEVLKHLLFRQPLVESVTRYDPKWKFFSHDPDVPIDVDLDRFRNVLAIETMLLPIAYFRAFGVVVPHDWRKPWLTARHVERPRQGKPFAILSLTPRYRGSGLDWAKVFDRAMDEWKGQVYFVGLPYEHFQFEAETGRTIQRIPTINLDEVASLVAVSEAVYCNQGSILTIAQALGKKCFLDPEPGHRACLLGLEEILSG